MKNIYEQVDENKFRSGLVVAGFIGFITFSAYAITYSMGFDPSFIGVALIISGLMSFAGFYYSDSIILSISGAVPATKKDHFEFYTVTENLVRVAGIPMPKLYVIQDSAMNALNMQLQISKERAAFEKIWKEREAQAERIIISTAGIYGSIQGVAGQSLPSVKGLDLLEP